MTASEAEETLSVIRTLMERGTRYTHLSIHAGLLAGVLALAGAALRWWWETPLLPTWIGVLVAACAAIVLCTAAMARGNGEPFWTRQARTVVLALSPSFTVALVLTAVLARAGQEQLLPGVWMLLWGVGALAMSFFTPRVISLLGMGFLVAGCCVLLLSPAAPDAFTMGATFGAMHIAYATVLWLRRQAACARWPLLRHLC
jgi:hypothetical protein